jgi:hypothetical protein
MLYVSQSSNSRHTFGVLRVLIKSSYLLVFVWVCYLYESKQGGMSYVVLVVRKRVYLWFFGFVGAVMYAKLKMKFIFY